MRRSFGYNAKRQQIDLQRKGILLFTGNGVRFRFNVFTIDHAGRN
jgi:hypothetical protein